MLTRIYASQGCTWFMKFKTISAKHKQSILEPNFIKSDQKVCFKRFLFENDPLDEPKNMGSRLKLYLFRKILEKTVIKIEFTPPPSCLQYLTLYKKKKNPVPKYGDK